MRYLMIVAFSVMQVNCFGQSCNCRTDFEWVKTTFEQNDAGFQMAIEEKGKEAYDKHNRIFREKIKKVTRSEDCTKALFEWLTFFRPGHIGIRRLTNENAVYQQTTNPVEQRHWDSVQLDNTRFENYLNEKKEIDFEGIWETTIYKIGIKRSGGWYTGFIMETTAPNWKPGQVKLKFNDTTGIYYLGDKSAEKVTSIKAVGNNYIQLGRFLLKRIKPVIDTGKGVELYIRSIRSETPFLEQLDSTTLLLRVPSFETSQKYWIDSVIRTNRKKIVATENLIIDLRNNGGGNDGSYREIAPLLYTNPVRIVGMQMLSTKLNNQRILDFINDSKMAVDDSTIKWARELYERLENKWGQFVPMDAEKISIQQYDTIFPYPKNVGIIINKGNASAAEQFLLEARQSKKVKLFGTSTRGVLDISNMHFVKSPCATFELGYCLTKSYRIPEMKIDGIGIQPDYYMDSKIEEYEWVEYVNKIINRR